MKHIKNTATVVDLLLIKIKSFEFTTNSHLIKVAQLVMATLKSTPFEHTGEYILHNCVYIACMTTIGCMGKTM